MSKWILIICLAVLAGCDSSPPPWEELRAGETANVYACGGWPTKQVNQIKLGVANINATMRHENGLPFLVYKGEQSGLYGEPGSEAPKGGRCAWWIHDNYPTPEGQALWDKAQREGWYGVYDGESVYGFMTVAPPPGQFTVWDVQGLIAHELGHAIGADHIDVGDGHRALMDPPHMAYEVTPEDINEICGHEVACDRQYSADAKARMQESARLLPELVADGTVGVPLGSCGTE